MTEYEKRLKCKSYPKDYKDSMKNVSIKARDGPDWIPMFRAVYRVSGRIIRLNIGSFECKNYELYIFLMSKEGITINL